MPPNNDIELRNPGVQEIFGKTPHWLLPWSNTIILIFVCVLFTLSYVIKYPDIISSKVTLTTVIPPVTFVPKINGGIRLVKTKDSQVKSGEFLAYMETGADINHVKFLIKNVDIWQQVIASENGSDVQRLNFPKNLRINQLESVYTKLLFDLEKYKIFLEAGEDVLTTSSLQERIGRFKELNIHLERQRVISEADLVLSERKTNIDSVLWAKKVIPIVEFNNSKSRHNQILHNLESSRSNYISNVIQIQQMEEQLKQIAIRRTDDQKVHIVEILNDLSLLRQGLTQFIQQNVFVSPVDGTISFPQPLSDNQYVTVGQSVFNVVPMGGKIYGSAALEMRGAGKVQIGQNVHIKLNNYPFNEFGYLRGKIASIEITPNENTYTATVELTNGLTTTYNRRLPFSYQMTGTAEIVTRDLRLLERFFNQFRNINN